MSDMTGPNILLVGATSMLGKAVLDEPPGGFALTAISHHQLLEADFSAYDAVINMAYDPRYMRTVYDSAIDFDRRVAERAARSGVHFVMMSTRRVYGPASGVPIRENDLTRPIDNYGANKLRTEEEVRRLLGDRCTILRVANVFGYEPGRHTFFGIALETLRRQRRIVLDSNPFVEKDFLPLSECAASIASVLRKRPSGIFNLGYGTATPLGRIAMWLIEGYSEGELLVTSIEERDAFLLDSSKLHAAVGLPSRSRTIRDHCVEIGKQLRNA
jgi:UDP-glucose 4-epimerase